MLVLLRKYVMLPLPIFWSDEGGHPSQVLVVAASTLALAVEICGNEDQAMSTVYSLLNYLPPNTFRGEASNISIRSSAVEDNDIGQSLYGDRASIADYTQEERAMVACSTIYTVSALAQHFKQKEMTKLVLGMLLQRIRNSDFGLSGQDSRSTWQQGINRIAFMGVANLATEASEAAFTETAQAFTEFARSKQLLSDYDSAAMVRNCELCSDQQADITASSASIGTVPSGRQSQGPIGAYLHLLARAAYLIHRPEPAVKERH